MKVQLITVMDELQTYLVICIIIVEIYIFEVCIMGVRVGLLTQGQIT